MTTAKAIQTPEPDTKPDSEPKTDKAVEKPVNSANLNAWIGIISSTVLLGGVILGVILTQDRHNNKGADTAEKVKQLEPVVARIPTIEVRLGYIDESQKRIEAKLDKALEAKK